MAAPLPVFSFFYVPEIQMERYSDTDVRRVDDPGQRSVVEPGQRYGAAAETFASARIDGSPG
jgi:hypothetical protein